MVVFLCLKSRCMQWVGEIYGYILRVTAKRFVFPRCVALGYSHESFPAEQTGKSETEQCWTNKTNSTMQTTKVFLRAHKVKKIKKKIYRKIRKETQRNETNKQINKATQTKAASQKFIRKAKMYLQLCHRRRNPSKFPSFICSKPMKWISGPFRTSTNKVRGVLARTAIWQLTIRATTKKCLRNKWGNPLTQFMWLSFEAI